MAKALKTSPVISYDLRTAYEGYYEDDRDFRMDYDAYVKSHTNCVKPQPKEAFLKTWCEEQIRSDTPKRRLEVYCEWNGIIGYAGRLYEIAIGGT